MVILLFVNFTLNDHFVQWSESAHAISKAFSIENIQRHAKSESVFFKSVTKF